MNLKELSKTLGLSQTTISRALNGFPEVSESTRARVAEAARRYGYRPNVRARGLATGRAMAIGHVIPVSSRHEIVNPIFADFIAGAGEVYSAADYDMVLSVVSDADEMEAYHKLKSRGTVDGVIVHAPRVDDARIPFLRALGMPCVIHGRSTDASTPYAYVDINNRRAFERATKLLLELGHRRIALLNGLEHMDFAIRRRRGYQEALGAAGVAPDDTLIRQGEMTESYGYRATRELMASAAPPSAYVTSSLLIAFGVRRAVEEAGFKVGRDISIVTHDDELSYMKNGDVEPIFTATRSSVRHAGRLCANLLLGIIAAPPDPLPTQLLECELVLGQSTGKGPQ